uniref:Defensin n=1 Tax=Panagrolaimus davidi TaxID=227884 RepID=A0A914QN13_9BILA
MMKRLLIQLILLAAFITIVSSLCANTGNHCTDTGCRLNGGHCNSVCICIQRQTTAELLFSGRFDSL